MYWCQNHQYQRQENFRFSPLLFCRTFVKSAQQLNQEQEAQEQPLSHSVVSKLWNFVLAFFTLVHCTNWIPFWNILTCNRSGGSVFLFFKIFRTFFPFVLFVKVRKCLAVNQPGLVITRLVVSKILNIFAFFQVSDSRTITRTFTFVLNQIFQTELANMTSPEATKLSNDIIAA